MARCQLAWMLHVTHPQTDCSVPSVHTTSKQPHTGDSGDFLWCQVALWLRTSILTFTTGHQTRNVEETRGGTYRWRCLRDNDSPLTTSNYRRGKYFMQLSDELQVQRLKNCHARRHSLFSQHSVPLFSVLWLGGNFEEKKSKEKNPSLVHLKNNFGQFILNQAYDMI